MVLKYIPNKLHLKHQLSVPLLVYWEVIMHVHWAGHSQHHPSSQTLHAPFLTSITLWVRWSDRLCGGWRWVSERRGWPGACRRASKRKKTSNVKLGGHWACVSWGPELFMPRESSSPQPHEMVNYCECYMTI